MKIKWFKAELLALHHAMASSEMLGASDHFILAQLIFTSDTEHKTVQIIPSCYVSDK